jgi:protoporphyrinogen oxidase
MSHKKRVVILGAGVGGLSAGYFLAKTGGYEVTMIEKESVIGGLCGSFNYDGFVLDYGAHKLYSVIPGILEEIDRLMGDDLLKIPKKNRLFLKGHLVDYPLQLGNLAKVLGPLVFLRLGFGYFLSMLQGLLPHHAPSSYEDFIIQRFGRPAYELVFEPLADKVWGNPHTLHPDMAATRIPAGSGLQVILKLLKLRSETAETNATFFYYPRGGFGDFPQALSREIVAHEGKILLNAQVTGVKQENQAVKAVTVESEGKAAELPCDYLLSSIALRDLGQLLFGNGDAEFNQAVSQLEFRHLVLVYLFVKRPLLLEDHWLFFPEREYLFSRVFEQKVMNPDLGPRDRTALCCDFTCTDDSWQWQGDDEVLAQKCIEGVARCGFCQPEDVTGFLVKRRTNFYPRYDLDYDRKITRVGDILSQVNNLILTGRIGMYNYNNADHCFDMGRFVAEGLINNKEPRQILNELKERVMNYKIVD